MIIPRENIISLFLKNQGHYSIIPRQKGHYIPLSHILFIHLFLFVFIPRFSTIGCCWCYFHIDLTMTLLTLFQQLISLDTWKGNREILRLILQYKWERPRLHCTRSLFSLLATSSFVTLMTFLSQTSFSNEAQIR